MRWPDELRGTDRASAWLNKLLRACISHAPTNSPDIRIRQSTVGTSLELTQNGGGGTSVKQYRLKAVLDNYYRCREWSGTTEGSTDIYIARPFTHRRSNFDPTLGGPGGGIAYSSDGDSFTATFSYSSATKRTKTIGGVGETQVIIPYFKVDFDIILAANVEGNITVGISNSVLTDPSGNAITLADLNCDGRAWAKLET